MDGMVIVLVLSESFNHVYVAAVSVHWGAALPL